MIKYFQVFVTVLFIILTIMGSLVMINLIVAMVITDLNELKAQANTQVLKKTLFCFEIEIFN